ncbi:MAG TPA: 50S ribosomal protein L2 [archaeon]|nr:50S ribosomal protein L2 [archaeon]
MGKNLRQQKRGKGGPRYRVPSFRYPGKVNYANMPEGNGVVIDIVHSPGRMTPSAVVDFNGTRKTLLAAEGVEVGQVINDSTENGCITQLKNIQEGTKIFNVELNPGDGGRLCRASGAFATVITKNENNTLLLMPSKEKKALSNACRATIGIVASSGRTEKPFMKAGTKFYKMRGLGKLYPHTSGVSMNACNHPFGGQTRPGKPKTVSRHAPPGRKVGSIAARRTGRKKK